jgi:preprotein translocase subunit YajC
MKMVSRTLLLTTLALSLAALPLLADATQPSGPELRPAPTGGTAAGGTTAAPAGDKAGEPVAGGSQEKKNDGTGQKPPEGGGGLFGGQGSFLFVAFGAILLMVLWSGRARKKQEAKRKELLNSLKKGDKITTIGGMIGTVIEVKEDEVTVKVDDNARVKFARWAIRGVGEEAKSENPDDKKK